MKRRFVRAMHRALLSAAIAVAGFVPTAAADGANDPAELAIQLGHLALADYESKAWVDAFEKFQAADRVMPSPVFQLYMARCLRRSGQLVAARAQFRRVVDEVRPPDAPKPWLDAVEAARVELGVLDAELPTLRLSVRGAVDPSLTLSVDRAPVEMRDGSVIPLDPGVHELRVARNGRQVEAQTVEVAFSERDRVVTLGPYVAPAPTLHPLAATKQLSSPAPPGDRPMARSFPPSAWVAVGIGAAATVVGAVTGLLAWREQVFLANHCDGIDCERKYESRVDRGRTLGNIATVGFTVGATGLITGCTLYYFAPKVPAASSSGSSAESFQLGVSGRF